MFPFDESEYDFSRRSERVSAGRLSGVGTFTVVPVEADNGLWDDTSGWNCSGGRDAIRENPCWEAFPRDTCCRNCPFEFTRGSAAQRSSASRKRRSAQCSITDSTGVGDAAIVFPS